MPFNYNILDNNLVPKILLFKAYGKLRTAHLQILSHYFSAIVLVVYVLLRDIRLW